VLFNKDRPVFYEAERIVPDEVLGIHGKLSVDGKLFFADSIIRPDIPLTHAPYRSDRPGKAAFISDTHIGSDKFLERQIVDKMEFMNENDWMYQEDNSLPVRLDKELLVVKGIYHRIIKGTTELIVKIKELPAS
jgi:DNA polymerase II small subunit/DNA polymerase delta subunit B